MLQVVYSINTTSAKSIGKTPYEVVFGQKLRCDIEMWQILSNQGVVNEEDLPNDFIGALEECDNFIDAVESSTLSNVDQPSNSYNQVTQTPPELSSTTLCTSMFHITSATKQKRRARLFSNHQVNTTDKDITKTYNPLKGIFVTLFLSPNNSH